MPSFGPISSLPISALRTVAAAAEAFPEGWRGQTNWAPKALGLSLAMVVASGATWVPYPVQQAVVATVEGWQRPLSTAAPRPPVWVGTSLVPFDTRQPNTQTIDKWLVPLSVARPIPRTAPLGAVVYPWQSTQFTQNTATPDKWLQPFGRPPRLEPRPTQPVYVFRDTQFTQNSVDYSTYQQPLSRPVDRRPVWQGISFVPFDTAQIIFNTVTIDKWLQPLGRSVPIPRGAIGFTFVPFDTAQVVAAVYGWGQPLSRAAPRPPVWQGGSTWVGRALAGNNVDIGRWLQPLAIPPRVRPVVTQPVYVFLSTQFTQNTVNWANYQQPLSRPAARPPVHIGYSYVPFNTAQVVSGRNYGYIVG